MKASERLVVDIEELIDEKVNERMKILEDTYFAEKNQTQFTTSELAAKWGCSKKHVQTVLKDGGVKPVGKRGHEHEYDGAAAQSAKDEYDSKVLYNRRISNKLKAM